MSRWEPDGRHRLQDAAMALYAERGFAATTAAAIAKQAGLTERTFFRHFPDKRDVLFGAEQDLARVLAAAVTASAPGATALQAAVSGLDAVARELQPHRARQQQRARIIAANPELRERELTKVSAWSVPLAAALVARDPAVPGQVAAEAAIAVFRVAYGRWTDSAATDLVGEVHRAVRELAGLTAGYTDA